MSAHQRADATTSALGVRFRRSVAPVALWMLLAPLGGAAAAQGSDGERDPAAATDTYRIGRDDLLDISVWTYPELARVVPVRPDGRISFPLVNDIEVAGLTPMELRQILTDRIATYVPDPEVTVIVREVHSFKVSIMGQIRAPGRYELTSQATVLDVLAVAEGLTEFAARNRILILRQKGAAVERIRFDYDGATSAGNGQANLRVLPGDIIVVP